MSNLAVLPKENPRAMLMDTEDFEGIRRPRPKVYGTLDTHLEIEHKNAAAAAVDMFVDGWVAARRNERPTRRSGMSEQNRQDWMYGYDLASERRLFFTQALHSFYSKLERERRI